MQTLFKPVSVDVAKIRKVTVPLGVLSLIIAQNNLGFVYSSSYKGPRKYLIILFI